MINAYDELKKKALSPYATQANVNAFGHWHKENGVKLCYLFGEACYIVDTDLFLKPVTYNGDTVGYEFTGKNAPKMHIKYSYWAKTDDGMFDFFVCTNCGRKMKSVDSVSVCPCCDSIMLPSAN